MKQQFEPTYCQNCGKFPLIAVNANHDRVKVQCIHCLAVFSTHKIGLKERAQIYLKQFKSA